MTNTIAEEAWQSISGRYDELVDLVDQSIARSDAQIANARSEYGGLNVLVNANAKESDGAGGYVSPLDLYAGNTGSITILSQRVLTYDDAVADGNVPAEIIAKMRSSIISYQFNLIEVTASQNGGNGQFRLLAYSPIRGLSAVGALYSMVAETGIRMTRTNYATMNNTGRDLEPGVLYEDNRLIGDTFSHINGMPCTVTGENKKLWVLAPFLCPGRFTGTPLFLNATSKFQFGDAN